MSTEKGKIYKITNKENGLIYIGCTINSLEKRFGEHLSRCFTSEYKSKLYNSIKKYGKESFIIELVEECDLDIIYETEKKYIKQYDSYNNGLNSTIGGEGCLGYTHSPEIRQKISENTKNGNSHKGKTYEELYGVRAEEERLKRKTASGWGKMTEEERNSRINNITNAIRKNCKYDINLVREIKQKINDGVKIKELKKDYPQVYDNFFYDIKNGRRWVNI
jgi:group I intron endonuclease